MRTIQQSGFTIQEVFNSVYGRYVCYVYRGEELITGREAEKVVADALMDEYGNDVFFRSLPDGSVRAFGYDEK